MQFHRKKKLSPTCCRNSISHSHLSYESFSGKYLITGGDKWIPGLSHSLQYTRLQSGDWREEGVKENAIRRAVDNGDSEDRGSQSTKFHSHLTIHKIARGAVEGI